MIIPQITALACKTASGRCDLVELNIVEDICAKNAMVYWTDSMGDGNYYFNLSYLVMCGAIRVSPLYP